MHCLVCSIATKTLSRRSLKKCSSNLSVASVRRASLAYCGTGRSANATLVCSVIEGCVGSWERCCSLCLLALTAWPATVSTTWASCELVYAACPGATVRLASLLTSLIRHGDPWIVGEVPRRRKDSPLVWPWRGGRRVCVQEGGASQEGGAEQVLVNTIHGSRQWRENDREVLRYRRVCVCWPSCQRVRGMEKAAGTVRQDKGRGRWYEPLERRCDCRVAWPARSAGVHRCVGGEDSRREPAGRVKTLKRVGCRCPAVRVFWCVACDQRLPFHSLAARLQDSVCRRRSWHARTASDSLSYAVSTQQWLRNVKGADGATGDMSYNIEPATIVEQRRWRGERDHRWQPCITYLATLRPAMQRQQGQRE